MAVISPDTFDALRKYVSVRLQQGVPLVDADWNAMEDTRRFELRAYLKWFVGDGVPEGNDAFRIVGENVVNDLLISQGYSGAVDPVRQIGRILVDGLDVMIDGDIHFRAQPLHTSQPVAANLAAVLGVPVIDEMPLIDGTAAVYLDIWERLVTPSEDPALVLPGLGTESCARMKREWVVRTRIGTATPTAGNADFIAGHSYYLLATVNRRAASGNVRQTDVTDRRGLRLLMPPAFLIEDMLGTPPSDYRHGIGRPTISLRDAINALLRGELPSSPDAAILPAAATDQHRRGFFLDGAAGLDVVWQSDRVGGVTQVFAARLDLGHFTAGFPAPPIQVTGGAPGTAEPHATIVAGGDVVVAYTKQGVPANLNVALKRAPLAGLDAIAEQPVTTTGNADTPFLVTSGDVVVVLWHDGTSGLWMYRRYHHPDNTWLDAAPGLQFSATATAGAKDIHAARDPAGTVWAAFKTSTGTDIHAMSFTPTTGAVANETTFTSAGVTAVNPFVLCRGNGEVHLFWTTVGAGLPVRISSVVFVNGAWGAPFTLNTPVGGTQPAAAELPDGRIWLVYTGGTAPTRDVFAAVRGSAGSFGNVLQLTSDVHDDLLPLGVVDPATGALYLLWESDRAGNLDLYYKRFVTAV